jgi:peptidyl-tRNA hydrolase, PTH1 family
MKYIFGLGNYEKKYENTRHNVGSDCIDFLRIAENQTWHILKKHSLQYFDITYQAEKIRCIQLHTYMNLSGDILHNFFQYYNIDIDDILVIYDDIDIPFESTRFRPSGSSGTHNGMRSICKHLGNNFKRLRIGIGSNNHNIPIEHFVLEKFSSQEQNTLQKDVFPTIIKTLHEYL